MKALLRGRGWQATFWVVALVLGARLAVSVIDEIDEPSHGFLAYYTASRLTGQGAEVSRFYDDEWFGAEASRHVPGVIEIYRPNLPTAVVLTLPLASFSYTAARAVWTLLSFLLLIGNVLWMTRSAGLGKVWTPVFLSLRQATKRSAASPTRPEGCGGTALILALLLLADALASTRRRA